MGALKGTVVRPSTGKSVQWVLAPGLAGLGKQLDQLGITWYSIGNADHLKKSGGHTPWKPGAPAGMVTAIDVMKTPDAMVEVQLVKLMKTSGYDTAWIDFANTNGHQYDWDGRYQGTSGDYHLHLECLGNHTTFSSNLFFDMFGWPTSVTRPRVIKPAETTQVATTVWKDDMLVFVKLTSRPDVYLAEGGVLRHITPAQLRSGQAFNLSRLPASATQAEKDKVTGVFTVATEEELATYGTKVLPSAATVEGI